MNRSDCTTIVLLGTFFIQKKDHFYLDRKGKMKGKEHYIKHEVKKRKGGGGGRRERKRREIFKEILSPANTELLSKKLLH